MDVHLLVEALREREPDARPAVYDAYADRLYAYCWFQLRNRDAAQVALRDTFILADAHVGRLRDPGRLTPWLYAIARLECARRLPPRNQAPDMPIASHDQQDADRRIIAWNAVLDLPPDAREILELGVRHRLSVPDLAAVFDVPLKDAQTTLEGARRSLEEALTAEVLAYQGPYGCAERAVLLRQRHGGPVQDLNHRLMEHVEECATCAAFRPRNVSAAKVYGLLPKASPPPELRLRVMSCFLDPELVGYRLFVSGRVTEFTPDGFPTQAMEPARPPRAPSSGGPSWLRRLRRALSPPEELEFRAQAVRVAMVLAVVALLSGGGIVSIYGLLGADNGDTVAGPHPTVIPGHTQEPVPGRRTLGHPESVGYLNTAPVSATFPLGSKVSSAPPTALWASPPETMPTNANVALPVGASTRGTLAVSPLFLDLAGDSDGCIDLRAEGGPVTWTAKTQGALRVHPSSGRLAAGQSVTVRVHVSRRTNSKGSGTITFQPGGSQVQVTWRPDAPNPDPTPTPEPTPTRSDPTDPSTPPGTHRPEQPSPSRTKSSSSEPPPSEPSPSAPPPSKTEPDPPPPAAEPAPTTPASSGASPTSSS
ncbi:sigma-70 family RNA polymerase sigma factor [Actinomadura sp. 7K534]|uniref:sigma-70 family RNA polymerase sigma factor n=1 Tax=Actinomadura sp. 7K534 TaxID=2530366 RepID=UPI00104E9D22|nr:sigma-70 family RNA polymerase sigma factor [Actinomadura sp. 7K534]TDB92767.1 sigma-70 family RNA polymerase sigma factor [Actinomadura sp. 7K534]